MSTLGPAPRPLAEAEPDRLARVRGLAFDVDDTITRHGRIEAVALAALERLREAGVRLVALTGRPLGWATVFARVLPVSFVVGENGAGWAGEDGAVTYVSSDAERAAQRDALDRLSRRVAEAFPYVKRSSDEWARRCDVAFDIGERVVLDEATIAAVGAEIRRAGMRAVRSTVHLHAVPGGWDKARGLSRALEATTGDVLEEQLDRWAFVGDSANDAEAFAVIPLSFGVANVVEHLHALETPPAFVARSSRGEGFAEIANAILAARI